MGRRARTTAGRTLATAHLLNRGVALANSLVERLLVEGDGAGLLEVLLAHLLLAGLELGDIGVVALLGVLVGALQDRLLLHRGDRLLLLDAAEPSLPILNTGGEVDATRHRVLLSALANKLHVLMLVRGSQEVGGGKRGKDGDEEEYLQVEYDLSQ